jgi:pentatricopeptide repeat protein
MNAAKRGHIDLNLLVWDLVESCGERPTECMFEDVILTFANNKSDSNSFAALVDMEKNGFVPSRALLRQLALKLSYSKGRLRHAKNILTRVEDEETEIMSTASMNTLLLGFGMRKDIDAAFNVFDDLTRYRLQPDINTFSFLMETLYIDTKERLGSSHYGPDDTEAVLGAVETVLSTMEELGIEPTGNFIYEHIRLLCVVGKLDDAKNLLDDAISNHTRVDLGSIVTIANAFIKVGDFEMARTVADLSVAAGCGETPFYLTKRISDTEQRSDASE